MFTGIIQALGTIKTIGPTSVSIDVSKLAAQARPGDSIAINGVCLTVTELSGSIARFDLSGETLAKTTLSKLRPSSMVNVETAMRADGRFGGHIVQGHVDGIAAVKQIRKKGDFADMTFVAPAELLDEMVVKGSVAIDGVSLTVADMDSDTFTVALIPETLHKTTLGRAKIADEMNIETDIIIKAVKKTLERLLPQKQALSTEKLKEFGF